MISAPSPPDPYQTAAAQAQMNKQTAITQQGLNSTDQYTPYGNLTYRQEGTWSDGTPHFAATQSLSPNEQNLLNLGEQSKTNLGNFAVNQTDQLQQQLGNPFQINPGSLGPYMALMAQPPANVTGGQTLAETTQGKNAQAAANLQTQIAGHTVAAPQTQFDNAGATQTAPANVAQAQITQAPGQIGAINSQSAGYIHPTYTAAPGSLNTYMDSYGQPVRQYGIDNNQGLTNQLFGAAMQTYQPQFDRQNEQVQSQLANQGLTPGSTGYDNSMADLYTGQNQLMSQTFLNGQNQAFNQSATRSQNAFNQGLQAEQTAFNQADTANQHNFSQGQTAQGQLFNQALQANNQNYNQAQTSNQNYWQDALNTNAQNFGQQQTSAQNAFANNLAANQQNYGQREQSAMDRYNSVLGANNQNFNQQHTANTTNYGQLLNNANFNASQLNEASQRLAAAAQSNEALQNQQYTQTTANNQFTAAQNQFNAGMYNANLQNALGMATQARDQPLNELSALMSGSQVQQPKYTSTPSTSVQSPDLIGAVNANYNARMQQYQSTMGGLGSIFGSLGGLIRMSDERLKEDVERVGQDPETGLNLYTYRYKPETGLGGGLMHLGLLAQDVEKKKPDAVVKHPSGFKAVDYGAALAPTQKKAS